MKKLVCALAALVSVALAATPALADTSVPNGGGGGKNVVIAVNRVDRRLAVRANLQVNRIPGPNVQPANIALATSSCTDCQTLVVALQLNIAGTQARVIIPQNVAHASNEGCLRCVTIARAVQYLFTVPDPLAGAPPATDPLLRALDRALTEIQTDPTLTLEEAEARLDAVIAEFKVVAPAYGDTRDVRGGP
jgi:hypothetical protein